MLLNTNVTYETRLGFLAAPASTTCLFASYIFVEVLLHSRLKVVLSF